MAEKSMCCKVCKDMGLSDIVYNSHNVKNEKGKVCCPTLMSIRCTKCSNMGHMEKYCTVKEKDISSNFCFKKPEETNVAAKSISSNAFAVFDDSSSSDVDTPVLKKTPASKRNWAEWSDSEDEYDEPIHPNITLRAHQTNW
jgi:hypothetical protein